MNIVRVRLDCAHYRSDATVFSNQTDPIRHGLDTDAIRHRLNWTWIG